LALATPAVNLTMPAGVEGNAVSSAYAFSLAAFMVMSMSFALTQHDRHRDAGHRECHGGLAMTVTVGVFAHRRHPDRLETLTRTGWSRVNGAIVKTCGSILVKPRSRLTA
jgi:hypothetical protein